MNTLHKGDDDEMMMMMMMIIIIIIRRRRSRRRRRRRRRRKRRRRRSLKKNLETVPGKHSIDSLQKTAILGTSHIIRKVLQCEA